MAFRDAMVAHSFLLCPDSAPQNRYQSRPPTATTTTSKDKYLQIDPSGQSWYTLKPTTSSMATRHPMYDTVPRSVQSYATTYRPPHPPTPPPPEEYYPRLTYVPASAPPAPGPPERRSVSVTRAGTLRRYVRAPSVRSPVDSDYHRRAATLSPAGSSKQLRQCGSSADSANTSEADDDDDVIAYPPAASPTTITYASPYTIPGIPVVVIPSPKRASKPRPPTIQTQTQHTRRRSSFSQDEMYKPLPPTPEYDPLPSPPVNVGASFLAGRLAGEDPLGPPQDDFSAGPDTPHGHPKLEKKRRFSFRGFA